MTAALARYEQQDLGIAAANFDTAILAGTKSPNTIEQYRMHFSAYLAFAGSFAVAIQPATLARWRQSLYADGFVEKDDPVKPYSVAAINQRLAAIRGVMTEAAQQGYITLGVTQLALRSALGLPAGCRRSRGNCVTPTPMNWRNSSSTSRA